MITLFLSSSWVMTFNLRSPFKACRNDKMMSVYRCLRISVEINYLFTSVKAMQSSE
jgi:hypothetical protein